MVYLDNAATTRPSARALEKFNEISLNVFGNSSSLHGLGRAAEHTLSAARQTVARTIGAQESEIYFTSGGTEANNIAILGAADTFKKGNIITTGYEHSSVYSTAKSLEKRGFCHVAVDFGTDLEDVIDENTAIVSIMLVNNETGLINPVDKIAATVRRKAPRALIHCDAIQGFGKIPFTVQGLGVDLLSAAAHKIGGVKGAGFLYIRKGVRIVSPVYGGGHESGIRSGTVNIAAIGAFAQAAQDAYENVRQNFALAKTLREYAREKLSGIPGIHFADIEGCRYSPYIMSVSVEGMRGETLLHYLSDREIYVATASACSSHSKGDARVLAAQGIEADRAKSTLRVSFGFESKKEDIDALAQGLSSAVEEINRGVRK